MVATALLNKDFNCIKPRAGVEKSSLMMPCGCHLGRFCCQIGGVKLVRTKDYTDRSLLVGKIRSHEFRVEATFDHLEGEQSYEP